MTTILICRDEHVACLATVTLARHWLYEGREVHRSKYQGRDHSITMTLCAPISPRLLAELAQLPGAAVLELPSHRGRSARATGHAK